MSVLTIRAHKRFAVRHAASLATEGGGGAQALVIELSLDGCRLSGIPTGDYEPGDKATVSIPGSEPLPCRVRWSGAAAVGLRFDRPLHSDALNRLIRICRGEGAPACEREAG